MDKQNLTGFTDPNFVCYSYSGISGGEKKRLAFGTELLNDPSIIFADEPTSGLDSYMTRGVCTTMRKLADSGKIIMCVIHQPSSQTFDLFTHLLLLAKGRVVFLGPLCRLNTYFSKMGLECPKFHNPADFYIQQLSIQPGNIKKSTERLMNMIKHYSNSDLCVRNQEWKKAMDPSVFEQKRRVVAMDQFHASATTQFYFTMKRNLKQQFR